jgi:hypothetical protein
MDPGRYWPSLSYEHWSDTLDTLHMKLQVIGKVKLALNPFINQWWHVAFYLNSKGMTTGLIPYSSGAFEIEMNFIEHNVTVRTINNHVRTIPLNTGSVADFYSEFMDVLKSMKISVSINTMPCEFPDPVQFELDHRNKPYDEKNVFTWWSILVKIQPVFESFRSGFRGKSSPVHFFWGSFDLCETRFSGIPCNIPPGSGTIFRFAENEENFSFGFWPGDKNYPHTAFYSYFYPEPSGIQNSFGSEKNYYNTGMREFILDYDHVIASPNPEELISEFLNETYIRGAKAAKWDIESLKAEVPSGYKVYG